MNRDILAVIQENMDSFSKGQKRIANYILESYDKAAFMTASKLGKRVSVSESTVVRFAAELGYDGYPSMQKSLQKMIRNRLTSVQRIEVANDRLGDQDVLDMVLQSDIDKIRQTLDEIDQDSFEKATDAIVAARRIYIIGVRSAAAIATFLGFYFNLIFDNVVMITANTPSEVFESLLRVGPEDVIVGVSFPRYSSRGHHHCHHGQRGVPPGSDLPVYAEGPQRHGLLCGLPGGPAEPGERPAGGGEPKEKRGPVQDLPDAGEDLGGVWGL